MDALLASNGLLLQSCVDGLTACVTPLHVSLDEHAGRHSGVPWGKSCKEMVRRGCLR